MQRELSETIKMCIELTVTAVVIGIVAIFAGLTYKAEVSIEQYEAAQAIMQDEAQLYYYNNKLVSGADVVDCIMKYTRVYDFKVTIEDTTYTFDSATEVSSGLGMGLWDRDYILTVIKPEDMSKSFTSEVIKDDTGYSVVGVAFEREE